MMGVFIRMGATVGANSIFSLNVVYTIAVLLIILMLF